MKDQLFNAFPDESKVWVYQANRPFRPEEETALHAHLISFIQGWTAHQKELAAGAEIIYHQFVVLAVDERKSESSGCSIDQSVRFLQQIGETFGLSFFDRELFAFKKEAQVLLANRNEMESLIQQGVISPETLVFNNLVRTMGDFRKEWEAPLKQGWMSNFFTISPQ